MKTMMTRLLAAAALCLLPVGAEAAVTYKLTGNDLNVQFQTEQPLLAALTVTNFTGQTCRLSSFTGGSSPCVSLTLDPLFKSPSGEGATVLRLSSNSQSSFIYFAADALSINGTYTAGFMTRTTLTVSGAPAFIPPIAAAVPEPATWAMMLVGFGLIGATARYRRRHSTVRYA